MAELETHGIRRGKKEETTEFTEVPELEENEGKENTGEETSEEKEPEIEDTEKKTAEDLAEEDSDEDSLEDDIPAEEAPSEEVNSEDVDSIEEIEDGMYNGHGAFNLEEPDPEALKKTKEQEHQDILNKVAQSAVVSDEEHIYERKLISAGRNVKREMYNDDGVIPIGDTLQYDSEGKARKREFLELVESQKVGKVLTGRITASTTIGGHITAVVEYGRYFEVLIPYELLIKPRPSDIKYFEEHNKEECERHRRLLVNQRILSEVDFVARQIDEASQKVIGDRISAMNRQMQAWYFGRRPNGEYIIQPGTKMEARVVYSTQVNMTVEVRGKEYRLDPKDISYRRIPDVAAEYPSGTTVPVVFKDITREKQSGNTYKLTAHVSVKEATEDLRRRAFDTYTVGSMVSAWVSGIEEYGIFARLGGEDGQLDVLCSFPRDEHVKLPEIKSTILVRIQRKSEPDDPEMRIYGTMVRQLRK